MLMVPGISLQKKWKGLRDSFVREMRRKKNAPSGSGASYETSYIHFQRLMFLERSVRDKFTESNFNNSQTSTDYDQDVSGDCEDIARPSMQSHTRKRKKMGAADAEFLDIIQKNLNEHQTIQHPSMTEQDDDKLFCLSLHKELLKVPEVNRLQTKIEMMHVLQRGQQLGQQVPIVSPHQMSFTRTTNIAQQPISYAHSYSQRPGKTTHREQGEYSQTRFISPFSQYGSPSPPMSSFSKIINSGRMRHNENETLTPITSSPAYSIEMQESPSMELFHNEI
ncbi:uncharacterized protein LOC123308387 [Coccinella septempunctata]|uniref:uncharacterized protein LOC123308387 n=1 Tax=Coccinella septempunctata TaxID=41139 RepID=UPI001D05F681|nr:uncharacterized protein LOC123308387 [Coccinella septempunctata]